MVKAALRGEFSALWNGNFRKRRPLHNGHHGHRSSVGPAGGFEERPSQQALTAGDAAPAQGSWGGPGPLASVGVASVGDVSVGAAQAQRADVCVVTGTRLDVEVSSSSGDGASVADGGVSSAGTMPPRVTAIC